MSSLADVLIFAGVPVRITSPAEEQFVTVKLNSGGAVRRVIGDGKVPVPFTGYRIAAGQFIYSRIDARNGAFAVVPPELDGAVVSKDFPVFDIRHDRIDSRYLNHFFRAGRLQRAIVVLSRGATNRQRIKEDQFLDFSIPLPSLEEQRRIAGILDQADAIRTKRRQVLVHLDTLTRSIFHDMFGDPESWAARWPIGVIGDMAESVQYGTSAKAGGSGAWPILRMGNVTDNGRLDLRDLKYLNLSDSDVPKYTTRRGDLLFNRTNSKEKVGKSCVVDTDESFAIAGYLVRVRFKPEHRSQFVCAYLTSKHGRSIRLSMAKAAVNQANINATEMRNIRIALPPAELQDIFTRRLQQVDAQRAVVQRTLHADDELFASLQARAFRGEL